jgi:hypothetical protein
MQSITDMPRSKSNALALNNSLAVSKEPLNTEQTTQCIVRILDASYKKADLQAVVDSCSHLSSEEKKMLLMLLTGFEPLFNLTLGAWKTMPISFE